MYLFSPHADLHLKAAELAVNHTEFYFDLIRKKIGDKEFSKFLSLEVCDENQHKTSLAHKHFIYYCLIFIFLVFNYFFNKINF